MKVSICIPIFNGEKYLLECLSSIKNQTFKDFEVIISDDNSNDSSLKIVEEFFKDNPCVNYKVITNLIRGIGQNWNNCLKNASGEYIKFLFQDDVLEPECLEKMVKVLNGNFQVGLVGCKRNTLVNSDNQEFIQDWKTRFSNLQVGLPEDLQGNVHLNKNFFKSKGFFADPINKIGEPSTVMFRRSIINEIGYFSLELIQTLDFEYWFKILKKHDIIILNQTLVNFRLHNQQATYVNKEEYKLEYLALNKFFQFNFFWNFNWQNRIEIFRRNYLFVRRVFKVLRILKIKF